MNATAERLLEVAPRLCHSVSVHELSPLVLCAEADCSSADFEQAFGTLDAYLVELQRRFDRRVIDHVVAITSGSRPGLMRVQLATETYLSACLDQRALYGWLANARHRPALQNRLRHRNRGYSLIFGAEMSVLGWPDPAAAARLYMSMVNEVAVVEHRVGHPQPGLRDGLWRLLRGPRPPASKAPRAN